MRRQRAASDKRLSQQWIEVMEDIAEPARCWPHCVSWAAAANWRILAAGLLSPQEAGKGRGSFPLLSLLSRDSAVNRYPRIIGPKVGVHFRNYAEKNGDLVFVLFQLVDTSMRFSNN